MEKTLKLEEFKTAKGEVKYNIYLKPKDDKDSLQVGDHLHLEKIFAEGIEKKGKFPTPYYVCQAKYGDKVVAFLLSQKEHEDFKNCGTVGTKVKVSLVEERLEYFIGKDKKTKQVRLVNRLKFETTA